MNALLPQDPSTQWVITMGIIFYVLGVSVLALVIAFIVEWCVSTIEVMRARPRCAVTPPAPSVPDAARSREGIA